MYKIFRNKIMIVTLVAIIILIIIGITNGGRNQITFAEKQVGNVITPVQKFLFLGSNFIADIVEPVTNIWKLDDLNEELKKENKKLQNKVIELTLLNHEMEELRELRQVLNYTSNNGIEDFITCDVIAKDTGNWYNMFTINAGLDNGITKNSAVLNGDGLIGLVYEVGDKWAKVISIIDNKSRVSFEVLSVKNDGIGIINGKGTKTLSGYLIDPQVEVNPGEKIITSGLGLYPKGIMIGKIKDVIVEKDELLKNIVVEPSVNFKKINRVFVIPNKGIRGQ